MAAKSLVAWDNRASLGPSLHGSLRGAVGSARGRVRGAFIELYSRLSSSLPKGYALPPLQVIVELTHRCNLSCSMCFIRREIGAKYKEIGAKGASWQRQELSEDDVVTILCQFPPTTRFTFTGGEPFIRKDIISILRRVCASHRCGIGTNGTVLSKSQAEGIVDLGIDFVQVSLDGPQEIHDAIRGSRGAFAKTVDAIGWIQERKRSRERRRPWFYANCPITRENVRALDRVVEITNQLGVEYLTFQVVSSAINNSGVRVDEELDQKVRAKLKVEAVDIYELERQLDVINRLAAGAATKICFQGKLSATEVLNYYRGQFDLSGERCIFPWVNAWISPYGEMFPCFGYAVGQMKERNALAVWNGERFRGFRLQLRDNGIFPGCLGCCHMRRHGGW